MISVNQHKAAVFFDRDGTLNHDTSYLNTPSELVLFPDTISSVQRCNNASLRVLVITNQSGLARGYFPQAALEAIHQSLREQLDGGGAWIDDIFVCPHHPDDACVCRKPNPGLIEQAMARYPIDLSKSYVIGDRSADIELAARMQIKGLLVTTGPCSDKALQMIEAHDLPVAQVVARLQDAVDWILHDFELHKFQ